MEEHHYCYGGGMVGCLYDYGPEFCEDKEDAIESLVIVYQDAMEEDEVEEMKNNLREHGRHRFEKPNEVGAHYCEVSKQNGPCPTEGE